MIFRATGMWWIHIATSGLGLILLVIVFIWINGLANSATRVEMLLLLLIDLSINAFIWIVWRSVVVLWLLGLQGLNCHWNSYENISNCFHNLKMPLDQLMCIYDMHFTCNHVKCICICAIAFFFYYNNFYYREKMICF